MKISVKALLLSALVFPGLGHLYLKKYIQSIFLIGISLVCLYFLLVTAVTISQEISDKILSGEISLDIVELSAEILKSLTDSNIDQLNNAVSVLLFCWIAGMIDSYRLGRKEDIRN